MKPNATRGRHRFHFSLRTLLILVSVAGLAFAWVHRARQQHVAVEALRRSNPGVTVLYDDRSVVDSAAPSPVRDWLSTRLGVDYVETVTGVELFYATDADLAHVARLPSVHWLSLVRSVDVTDRGLAELAVLADLKTLILMDAGA